VIFVVIEIKLISSKGAHMTTTDLGNTAQALVAGGKGILAADETVPTVTRRLDALKIASTPDSRRAYREMFFTTPEIAEFISGVIMQDERSARGIRRERR
jgi:fructose-bisphosphate aldolase class I